ncbi:MAG: hypothetical protein K8R67_03950 [Desulfobacteraceae bacterium]|nr:hypothetical protein [Desulfobacteraceae bacterium]
MQPVTDVTSYVYYLQQIKKMASMYSEAKSFKKGNFKKLEKVIENLSGSYNMGKGLQGNLKDIQSSFDDITSGKLTNLSQYQAVLKEIEGFTNAKDLVKIVWCGDEKVTPWKKQKIQHKIRQGKLKNIIINNEKRLEGIGDRISKIEDLSIMIDHSSNKNMKSAQDLTSRILIEVLSVLTEQLLLSANYYEAQAMLLYTGEQSDEEFEKEQKAMQKKAKDDKGKSGGYVKRTLNELDADNRTDVQRAKDRNAQLRLQIKKRQAKEKKQ